MNSLETYIKSYFGVVNQQEVKEIMNFFKIRVLEKGEFLVTADRRCKSMAFVQTGFLRMYSLVDGKEVTNWISTSGYFAVDLSSFIFESPSRWNILALTKTEIFEISKDDYNKLSLLIPQWNTLEKLFLVRCFSMMEDRILSHLSLGTEERYDYLFKNQRELFNHVPLQYLASMLGMTPETFSRIRKKQLG